jgi:hypothetical protein
VTFHENVGVGKFIDPRVIQASAAAGDLWYPYAVEMPLTPEAVSQPKRERTTTFVLHTESGPYLTTLQALWVYLNRSDVNGECTWILDMDGRCAQLVPVTTRADNNFKANAYATSVETQDYGYLSPGGVEDDFWTPLQTAQLAGLTAWQWLHPDLDIPRRRADQGATGGGVDGHYRYAEWSSFVGKSCPGLARRSQIDEILELAMWIIDWETTPVPVDPEEDDMKRYLARLDTNQWHIRRGDGVTGTVVRASEANALKARFDTGQDAGTRYFRPDTPGIDRPGEQITTWSDIPVLTETQLDLDVGYVLVPTSGTEGGAPVDEG